ncbi:MAG: hypothetical protein ABIH77_01295 [Pseudomonadota bacterium]|nr:hypothetical protein [Gammaproteobacteria bacterium]MBU1926940.1 hypothetical protein [Gammaproteobacteria bacterium]
MSKDKYRKNEIEALLKIIKKQFSALQDTYSNALEVKEVPFELKIKIKNYLENARSILDYLMCDIFGALQIIPKRKIYFPIFKVHKGNFSVQLHSKYSELCPALQKGNQKLFDYLERLQPYHFDMKWIADFVEINIENKHSRLTPQIRYENPSLEISNNGPGICLMDGASVSLGEGCSISLGGGYIPGGQTISTNSSFTADSSLQVKREIWFGFLFNNEIDVLNLLTCIQEKLPVIVSQIYKLLGL